MQEKIGLILFLLMYIIAPLGVGYWLFVRPAVGYWRRVRRRDVGED